MCLKKKKSVIHRKSNMRPNQSMWGRDQRGIWKVHLQEVENEMLRGMEMQMTGLTPKLKNFSVTYARPPPFSPCT